MALVKRFNRLPDTPDFAVFEYRLGTICVWPVSLVAKEQVLAFPKATCVRFRLS